MHPRTIYCALLAMTFCLIYLVPLHPKTQNLASIGNCVALIVTTACEIFIHNAIGPDAVDSYLLSRCLPLGTAAGVGMVGVMTFGGTAQCSEEDL